MEQIRLSVNEGFDRLQRLLLAMQTGDELCPPDAARATGLSEATCRAMLVGLERAGLMARRAADLFVRETRDGAAT